MYIALTYHRLLKPMLTHTHLPWGPRNRKKRVGSVKRKPAYGSKEVTINGEDGKG